MTEKLDFKTDQEVGALTVSKGIEPITGLEMRRRFKGLRSDLHTKEHTIMYEEWLIAKDGKVYEDFYTMKTYKVVDINDIVPPYPAFTQWFNQLGPVLLPAISDTLFKIPTEAPAGYVTQP